MNREFDLNKAMDDAEQEVIERDFSHRAMKCKTATWLIAAAVCAIGLLWFMTVHA